MMLRLCSTVGEATACAVVEVDCMVAEAVCEVTGTACCVVAAAAWD